MAANVSIVITYKDSSESARKKTADGLGEIGDKAEESGKQLTAFERITNGALEKVGHMAVSALTSAGEAFLSFVGNAVKSTGDYEQSMNMFAAVTGASTDQLAAAKEEAKALGADLTLPATSAASAGDAMTALAQAGLSVTDAMAAAKGTLQLAAAGSISEAEAAQTAAAALNQFHLAGSEAVHVADLLAASVSASGSSVTQTGQAVQQAGSAFAAAKVPIGDFVTLINEMSKAGIKGSDAGTSLKTMLMRLQAPTDAAAQEMQRLGIHVYDAQGAMLPMRDIIGQFSGALGGLTQKERDNAVVTIFGSDAQRAANIVLAGGVAAYDKMYAAVNRQNAAADLAKARMTGLNGAIEGLSSQVETLALEAIEPLLPLMTSALQGAASLAGSFSGKLGPAVSGTITFIGDAIGVIREGFIPAVAAATAITIVYAVSALAPVMVNVPAMTAVLIYNTGVWLANAAAVAAAAIPLIAIAVAVGGVVLAYQHLQEQITGMAASVLESRQWWQDSATALENFKTQSGDAAAALSPLAASIQAMRDQIEGEVESLGRRMTMGQVSQAQYDAEMATINQHRLGLQQATDAYNNQEQAILRTAAASQTGTARLQEMQAGEQQVAAQTDLTEKEFAQLQKQMEKTFQDGAKAVSDYVTTEVGFLGELNRQRQEGYDKNLQAQAVAYATEQAAQRAHLGQMLTDYTLTQVQLGNIQRDQGQKIIGQIEQQFGVQRDLSAATFLGMTADIDAAAAQGGAAIERLGGHLSQTADDAVALKQKMDALKGQYTAELVQNFQSGKIDADEFARALRGIERRVEIAVHTTYTHTGTNDTGTSNTGSAYGGGRAIGGPVTAGTPYVVGEKGPEMFVPNQSGTIVPNGTPALGNTTYNITYIRAPNEPDDVLMDVRMARLLYG